MIPFRQHVVTIVAIFLALALGMLAGSAFIQPRLVEQLRAQVAEQARRMGDLREEVGALRDRLANERAFNDVALAHLTEGRLLGQQVVVLSLEGLEGDALDEARRALDEAGAISIALQARAAFAPTDPEAAAALAELLGEPDADPPELAALAARALAERLATDPRREPRDEDLLRELLAAGYLTPIDAGLTEEVLADIGGPHQVVLILAGGPTEDPPLSPEAFAVPLVERLADLGLPVAAGEPVDSAVPFVEILRDSGRDGLVTVDDVDESRGAAALVLGLQRLILTGDGGHYGVKDGSVPLPPP
ncbi:MAG: hypothetical protein KatS3mg014_1327 [Actinomycetota bacterium]|nr:MAG: hypothetical protein KatS3mg014_1327 [Actinomycetota bacterium]